MKTIGKTIRAHRVAAGLTLWELAKKAGIHDRNLRYYEDDTCLPSCLTLIALADALGLTIDELIGRDFKRST